MSLVQAKAARIGAVAFIAVAGLLVAGCSSNEGSSGGKVTVDENALAAFKELSPADDAGAVDVAGYKTDKTDLKIGYVDIGLVNSWRVQALGSAQQLADQLGVELIPTDAGGDPTKQISDAEDLLARGVDALLVSPVSPDSIAPIVERAYESGIPVIVWGSDVNTEKVTSRIVADDFYFGQEGGKKLVSDLNGKGNVIMLRGIAGNSVEQARYDGAMSAFEGTDIKVIGEDYGDWAFDKGKSITENMLAAHPDIDGIWASGAAMTRGAIEAFQEAGRPLVPMSGENLNGFLKVAADIGLPTSGPVFPTWQAPEAVKLAVRALRGLPFENSYLLHPVSVTDAKASVVPEASDDYWVEGYLDLKQIMEIFPK